MPESADEVQLGRGNPDRVVEQLQRSLNLMEEDYRRTLEAENRAQAEVTTRTQDEVNGFGHHAEQEEDDDEDDDATIPQGYAALGAGSDAEEDDNDSEDEGDIKQPEEEERVAAAPLSQDTVREIQNALSGLQLPEPEWAKGLTDEKLLGEVRSVLAVHSARGQGAQPEQKA